MKTGLKCFLAFLLLLAAFPRTVRAGQQVYLSESPNGKYRVFIEQVIERRVGDRVFFRYPISLINTHNLRRHFEIRDGGSPLVKETEKGTFHIRWDGADSREPSSIHFTWAPDSLRLFIQLEVIEGTWRTFFVDVNSGVTTDITADLEKDLLKEVQSGGRDCQNPKWELVKWTKPTLAFLKVTSICGKEQGKSNAKLFYTTDSILFETTKGQIVSHCLDCKEAKADGLFDKYFMSTIPTPTPTPEETPVTQ